MTHKDTAKVLVTGATGMQGGAVARALVRRGEQVTALVRNPASDASRALTDEGIALVAGDLEDPATLRAAAEGHRAVFSVQLALLDDKDAEVRHARNLVAAAKEAGIVQFVQTTVSSTGWRDRRPDAARELQDDAWYWDAKEAAEAAVRAAGFDSYTIVKPAFFMENFTIPRHYEFAWPHLASGELVTACPPSTELALLCAPDFGALVAEVLTAPDRFAGVEIELASERRTFTDIADALSSATGRPVTARQARPDDDLHPLLLPGHQWWAAVGYPARPEDAEEHGLPMPTKLPTFLSDNRDALAWIGGAGD